MTLHIPAFDNDDANFLTTIDRVIADAVAAHAPDRFAIYRIDNWFSSRWLGFTGKRVGALGVRIYTRAIVPPFVPNRITAQCLFNRQSNGDYAYTGEGPHIHHSGPSGDNLTRQAQSEAPDTALFWFSGNSKQNGRASLMGYVPTEEEYWMWYTEFRLTDDVWKTVKHIEIDTENTRIVRDGRSFQGY